ncbi:MAG: tRNA pseudouridine(38-40) synthase TruA [Reichenbachiella sp.]
MKESFYLLEIQYLGFRYHGWQKQPEVNTVQRMVERTLKFVLKHEHFKTLVTGRTDAMVSASQTYFELFLKEPIDANNLLHELNYNLPADIRVLSIEEVNSKFNVIKSAKMKEYHYLFSFGGKNHPFAAPFMCYLQEDLDINAMIEAATLFQGIHNFENYCYKPSDKTVFEREIVLSEIAENDVLTANFFPKKSYLFRVRGAGFMRHQVRMMMGSLISVGKGEIDVIDIEKSLSSEREAPLNYIAPASGLMLHEVNFE